MKDSPKRLFIRTAGLGRIARMGMQPETPAAGGNYPCVYLSVEKVAYRGIIELDRGTGADLADELHIGDVQQVVGRRDSKSADLGLAQVPQK
jgi:hypothetical protein